MKGLKTRRSYHDSKLVRAEWMDQRDDLRLTVLLDGHWNDGTTIEASVVFTGVRNRAEVEQSLRTIGRAEVVSIGRQDARAFLVDTSQGALVIDAAGFSEI